MIGGIQNFSSLKLSNKLPLWPRFFIVAAIAAVLSVGLFYNGTKNKESVNHAYGLTLLRAVGATLTLAGRQKISLKMPVKANWQMSQGSDL
ncbi:hypothetical protein CS542_07955 [Pedobacter sp. IW39]|nr:hypothetical protein CS542_07955 [Pedobacter sp. IW39]